MINKKIAAGIVISTLLAVSTGTLFASTVDVTQLPLGDGKISTSPKVGYVYACETPQGGGGAQTVGSWIHGSTWNLKEKLVVQGSVTWPNAQFTISTTSDAIRLIKGNGLPVDSVTGVYPIASTDPAYQFDRNPNTISAQSISYTLPTTPKVSDSASCVSMGVIGVATNGVAIFNPLDGEGRDAVAHEEQDVCAGHPERQGMYHYHGPSSCLPHQNENAALVGYALDGFGIYSNHDAQGNEIATKDLDECHGTTSEVMWDGKKVSMYHYVVTQDYPYTIGCFKGTAAKSGSGTNQGQQRQKNLIPTTEARNTNASSTRIVRNLSVGVEGDDVAELQTYLEQKGYLTMPKGVKKGRFGGATREALKKFQKANGITPTGTFGPKTRAAHENERGDVGGGNKERPEIVVRGEQSRQERQVATSSRMEDRMERGVPERESRTGTQIGTTDRQPMGTQSSRMMVPPVEAVTACDSPKEEGSTCSFVTSENRTITGMCREIQESLACVPVR